MFSRGVPQLLPHARQAVSAAVAEVNMGKSARDADVIFGLRWSTSVKDCLVMKRPFRSNVNYS